MATIKDVAALAGVSLSTVSILSLIHIFYDEVWGEGVYKCVGVQSEQVVYGGGNIHCITQQEPSA